MDEELKRPENTREFVAMWNTVTAEHLSHKLAGILQQLAERDPGAAGLTAEQASALSPILIRAFQVAASGEGGAHAAVQFLGEYAAPDE